MDHKSPLRPRLEAITAIVSAIAVALTLISPTWIEGLTGIDPDRHNGVAEWLIVAIQFLITITMMMQAKKHWRPAATGRS